MYENKKLGFLFVLGVLLFKLFPFVTSFALSFTQFDIIDPPQWVGLQNYRELFGDDPLFRKSLGVTLWFAALAVPLRLHRFMREVFETVAYGKTTDTEAARRLTAEGNAMLRRIR